MKVSTELAIVIETMRHCMKSAYEKNDMETLFLIKPAFDTLCVPLSNQESVNELKKRQKETSLVIGGETVLPPAQEAIRRKGEISIFAQKSKEQITKTPFE